MQNEKRIEAKQLYDAGLSLVEIAEQLELKPGTLRSWKKRGCWDGTKAEALQTVAVQRNAVKTRKRATDSNKQIVQAIEVNDELTDKEKDFCLYFVASYNAAQSAIKAGYKGSYLTLKNTAYEVLHKPAVQEMIAELKAIKRLTILAGVDDVLELHMRIAFADIGDYVNFGQREQQLMGPFGPLFIKASDAEDAESVPIMKTVNFIDLNEKGMVDTVLLSEISQGRDGVKVKLQDRQKSLDFLERYFLINPMDQHKIKYDNKRLEIEEQKNQDGGENDEDETVVIHYGRD